MLILLQNSKASETGEEFSQALSERARASVPVSVIIDWVGSNKMEQSLLDAMQAAAVQSNHGAGPGGAGKAGMRVLYRGQEGN